MIYVNAPLGELQRQVDEGVIAGKGEFVVVVAGGEPAAAAEVDIDRLLTALLGRLSAKDTARVAAEITGEKKNALYERVLELRNASGS